MQGMRDRDSFDAITSIIAVIADMVFIWFAQMLAVWLRYDSGFFYGNETIDQHLVADDAAVAALYHDYAIASGLSLLIYLAVFQLLKLYTRPQSSTFVSKIPRIVRACLLGGAGVLICTGLLKNVYPFISNGAVLISMATVSIAVLIERAIAFRLEIVSSRKSKICHRALILGANDDAALFLNAVRREPRMRTQVVGIMQIGIEERAEGIPDELYTPTISDLRPYLRDNNIDLVILASHTLTQDEKVSLVVFCEQSLVRFTMIPDLFRMMTNRMDFQMVGNIPLVGIGHWPLDKVWNRISKRIMDIIGGLFGLMISLPIILVSAIIIKCESKGGIFYAQERCGRNGKIFKIYKLRTMRADNVGANNPAWTAKDDPRRTKSGTFMRKWNIDELPQFWNVLKGEMSLVGPRPEQPFYVEQFTQGIEHYMWRHISKPGLTGWAQVNGFRGDTSISKRVKYDLYYLENWSLAFDFKIMAMTFFSYKNAG